MQPMDSYKLVQLNSRFKKLKPHSTKNIIENTGVVIVFVLCS